MQIICYLIICPDVINTIGFCWSLVAEIKEKILFLRQGDCRIWEEVLRKKKTRKSGPVNRKQRETSQHWTRNKCICWESCYLHTLSLLQILQEHRGLFLICEKFPPSSANAVVFNVLMCLLEGLFLIPNLGSESQLARFPAECLLFGIYLLCISSCLQLIVQQALLAKL